MVKDQKFLERQLSIIRLVAEQRTKPRKDGKPPVTPGYPFWSWILTLSDIQLARLISKCYDERPSKILRFLKDLRYKVRKKNKLIEGEIEEPKTILCIDYIDYTE